MPVIVPWREKGGALCDRLRYGAPLPSREVRRGLQRLTVQIPTRIWEQHSGKSIEMVHDRIPLLISPETQYSERVGLTLDNEEMAPLVL